MQKQVLKNYWCDVESEHSRGERVRQNIRQKDGIGEELHCQLVITNDAIICIVQSFTMLC